MYYEYIKMSFQESVIKEITEMTTTKSSLWKFEVVYPLAYKAENNDEYEFSTRVVQTTIILDYETFKKGFRSHNCSCAEEKWNDLTNGRVDTFHSRTFDTINRHIEEASNREGINLDDAYVTILSKTLLN